MVLFDNNYSLLYYPRQFSFSTYYPLFYQLKHINDKSVMYKAVKVRMVH